MRDFWIETGEDSWKDLAVKGKEQDFLAEWERNFAYNRGDLVRYGNVHRISNIPLRNDYGISISNTCR